MNFLAIVKLTIPVMMGYIPLGMAFGLLLSKLLIPWYYAFFMSVFIFAGSGQFLALTLFASQATILEIGIATFLLNLRHTFYGLSMISTFKAFSWKKHYLIFGLTDETFALLKTSDVPEQNREKVYLWITFLNQCYWIIGSVVGADFGEFYRAVEWMGLQRHLKVAGIFARLTLRDDKPKYLADAPRFLHYIRSTANRYRQLGPLLQLVDEIEGTTPVTGFAYGRM